MFKKIIAAIATASVMATGICTGVPMGTGNEPIMAITAEAANTKLDLKLTAYDDGTADLTWNEVDGAYFYVIEACYERKPEYSAGTPATSPYYDIKCAVAVGAKEDFKTKVDFWGTDFLIDVDVKAIPSAKYTDELPDIEHYNGYKIAAIDKNGKIIGEFSEGVTTLDAKIYSRSSSTSSTAGTKQSTTKVKTTTVKFTKSVGSEQFTIKWNKFGSADAYGIYLYNASTQKYEYHKTVTGTQYTFKNLKKGTKYSFYVAALEKKNGKYYIKERSQAAAVTTKNVKKVNLTEAEYKELVSSDGTVDIITLDECEYYYNGKKVG
ncbi:MAG: fibronectin type III domain-containing protein [Eubacterium sp.]|nr:fibronectin type III domain-containing protein [Eubacterium sp.]